MVAAIAENVLKRIAREARDAIRIGPAFPLRHISELIGRRLYSTKVAGVRVHLRSRSTDGEVFRQIFSRREYDFSVQSSFDALMSVTTACCHLAQCPLSSMLERMLALQQFGSHSFSL